MRWNPHETPRAPTTDDYLGHLRPQILIPTQEPGRNDKRFPDGDLRLDFYMINEDEVNPDSDLQMMLRDNVDPLMSGTPPWDQEMLDFQRDKIENYDPSLSTIPDFSIGYSLTRIARYLTERIFTDSNGDEVIEVDPDDLRDLVDTEWGFVVTDNDSIPPDHPAHPSQGLSINQFVEEMSGGALLGEERWDLVFYAMELAINEYVRDQANNTPIENQDATFRFRYPDLDEPVRSAIINRTMTEMPSIVMTDRPTPFLEDINERVMDLFARRGLIPTGIPVDLTYTIS